jgi:hypothetical protein
MIELHMKRWGLRGFAQSLSLTLFAPVSRWIGADKATLQALPFDTCRVVRLISNHTFLPIKTITYVPFYGLAYFLLTLVADKPPKPAGKTDTPFPPTPGPIGSSQTHDFLPTFVGANYDPTN